MERGRNQKQGSDGPLRVVLRDLRRLSGHQGRENEKFRAIMGNLYGTKPEKACLGCKQPDPPKKMYALQIPSETVNSSPFL
jgi:hypothetical protein